MAATSLHVEDQQQNGAQQLLLSFLLGTVEDFLERRTIDSTLAETVQEGI